MTKAYVYATHFTDRPSHADQLGIDLWWHNLNVALDAGTFQYNAPPPWDNVLARTAAHNTVQIDGKEQMTRSGRFLWLDWAQAVVTQAQPGPDGRLNAVEVEHAGYRGAGVTHRRFVSLDSTGGCRVVDRLLPIPGKPTRNAHSVRLHWLLPDWEWEMRNTTLSIHSPGGWINLAVNAESPGDGSPPPLPRLTFHLVRAGQSLIPAPGELKKAGSLDSSVLPGSDLATEGWFSPTYAQKIPALSFSIVTTSPLPVILVSQWTFPQRFSRNP